MSLTSKERHNPPPRQKSCAACIKAKRRCDAGSPSCLRCSQRGIPCVMPTRKGRRVGTGSKAWDAECRPDPNPAFTPSSLTPADTPFSSTVEKDGTPPVPMDPSYYSSASASACAMFDNNLWGSLDTNMEDPLTLLEGPNMETEEDAAPFSFNLDPVDQSHLGLIHQPSMLAPPTTDTFVPIPEIARKRLQYPIEQIQKAPSTMVRELQTPWSHPKLWEDHMPKPIQDAISCCALYMSKNRINSPVVLRTIQAHVNDLVAAPTPTTAAQCLAHTQALLLYQIICIFDGDIGARAAAERTHSALEDSAMTLLEHVNFDIAMQHPAKDLPLSTSSATIASTRAFWRDWIFHESGRRTLLFCFFLLQAYRILAGHPIQPCDGRLGMCHSFMLAAPLWHASSPVEFARRWATHRHLVIKDGELEVMFRDAKPCHVDAFGRILMTSFMGFEEAEAWFAARGGSIWPESV